MDYRTIDDMYERGNLVRLTDSWTPGLGRYRDRAAVVIDIEVLGYPRTISRQENGNTISEKYDCIYTVALMPDEQTSTFVRAQVPVIRVISLDVERSLAGGYDRENFAEWCMREFCGAEPEPVSHSPSNENGRVIGSNPAQTRRPRGGVAQRLQERDASRSPTRASRAGRAPSSAAAASTCGIRTR